MPCSADERAESPLVGAGLQKRPGFDRHIAKILPAELKVSNSRNAGYIVCTSSVLVDDPGRFDTVPQLLTGAYTLPVCTVFESGMRSE